jgi:hypothetical protein
MLLMLIIRYCHVSHEHAIEKRPLRILSFSCFSADEPDLASPPAQNKIDKIIWFIYFEIFKPYELQIETIIAGREWNWTIYDSVLVFPI